MIVLKLLQIYLQLEWLFQIKCYIGYCYGTTEQICQFRMKEYTSVNIISLVNAILCFFPLPHTL